MTTANKISVFRILLVPVFIVAVLYYVEGKGEGHRLIAVLSFGIAALSDGLDGYIARRYNQRSELGAILDPLGDKLLLLSGAILLSFHHEPYLPQLPLWLTVTVISRDGLLVLGAVLIRFIGGRVVVRPHWSGKVATVLLMACLLWALLKFPASGLLPIALAATAFTILSATVYLWFGLSQLSANPASLPSPAPSEADHRPPV